MSIEPPITELLTGFSTGSVSPIETDAFSGWSGATKHEANIQYALRHYFETNDWAGFSQGINVVQRVYGPEVAIPSNSGNSQQVDLLLDVPGTGNVTNELIGIEVKPDAKAFEQSSAHLDQIRSLADSGHLDRLYVCTPDGSEDTRLDVDPEGTQLLNKYQFSKSNMAFRGVEGTMDWRGNEISKPAYYQNYLNTHGKEKLIEELERRGDLERVEQNLEDEGALDTGPVGNRGEEWVYDELKKVGILRMDVEEPDVRCQKEMPQRLTRTAERTATRDELPSVQDETEEVDVVAALWQEYAEHDDASIVAEPPLHSLNHGGTGGSNRRIDLAVTNGKTVLGIEAKGSNFARTDQLRSYSRADELDAIALAVPEAAIDKAKQWVGDDQVEATLVTVSDPRGDTSIEAHGGTLPGEVG